MKRVLELFARVKRCCAVGLLALLVSGAGTYAMSHGDGHGTVADRPPADQPRPVRPERPQLGASAAFSPDGTLYAVSKAGEHVLLYRSSDLGVRWSAPQVVNAVPEAVSADGENRPKIAFTTDGWVLVSWTRPLAKRFTGEIRLARAAPGEAFSEPITVHHDRSEITHRFESMVVLRNGQVVLAWIDKRDLELAKVKGEEFRGAGIYAAVSNDGGQSFEHEVKVADHSCECCRIALAEDVDGHAVALWRHVFEPNERDHAMAKLDSDAAPTSVSRATFDKWRVDGCPHHGPSLAIAPNGARHAVWFNQLDGMPRVLYGRLSEQGVEGQRIIADPRAVHADVTIAGNVIAVAWKSFDGEKTRLWVETSTDGGREFSAPRELAGTNGASDQPRLITRGEALFVFWNTLDEGMGVYPL